MVWKVKNGDPKKGETMTSAPLVIKDKVLVGICGGEFGVRGHVTAYDLKDGKQAWRAYSIGPDDRHAVRRADTTDSASRSARTPARPTWQGDQWKLGGGTTWGWYSYDPELNLIYYGIGQPRHLEPGAAAGRQQLVDDHLRARPRHRRWPSGSTR